MRLSGMRAIHLRWLLAPVLAAVILVAALIWAGFRAFGPCQEGSAAPSLVLWLPYVQAHPDITRIRLCVRGGGCATERVRATVADTGPAVPGIGSGGTPPIAVVAVMNFDRLIPARVASAGPDGGPVHLRLTAYRRPGAAVVSASATLTPIRQLPANRCELRGYSILAQFTPAGTLGYFPIA